MPPVCILCVDLVPNSLHQPSCNSLLLVFCSFYFQHVLPSPYQHFPPLKHHQGSLQLGSLRGPGEVRSTRSKHVPWGAVCVSQCRVCPDEKGSPLLCSHSFCSFSTQNLMGKSWGLAQTPTYIRTSHSSWHDFSHSVSRGCCNRGSWTKRIFWVSIFGFGEKKEKYHFTL